MHIVYILMNLHLDGRFSTNVKIVTANVITYDFLPV